MPLNAAVDARILVGNKKIVIKELGIYGEIDERIGEFLDAVAAKPHGVLE